MTEQIKIISLPVGVPNVDMSKLLVELGACPSRSRAKRLIEQGAVSIDGKVIMTSIVDLPPENPVLRCGKRFYRWLIMPVVSFKVSVDKDEGVAKILEEIK